MFREAVALQMVDRALESALARREGKLAQFLGVLQCCLVGQNGIEQHLMHHSGNAVELGVRWIGWASCDQVQGWRNTSEDRRLSAKTILNTFLKISM
jgi:hypothetical protein